jgi:hypothetical protein
MEHPSNPPAALAATNRTLPGRAQEPKHDAAIAQNAASVPALQAEAPIDAALPQGTDNVEIVKFLTISMS